MALKYFCGHLINTTELGFIKLLELVMPILDLSKPLYFTDDWEIAEKTYAINNPTTGKTILNIADCGVKEAKRAVKIADESFLLWRQKTAFERSKILMNWYELILEHVEELAQTMTLEMAKPIRESRGEVAYAAGFVNWYAEEAKRVYGETFPSHMANKRAMMIKQPVGPVFAITPWNFPLAMLTRKAAPALAAGCTVILKPAEQTPISALLLAKLWQDAGGPSGTLQVLPCEKPAELSELIIADPRIRKITFTGSTKVGKLLYKQSAETVKKISLELGGHAPFIIFEDADIELAVKEVVASKFRNSGQTCVCTNRIYTHSSIVSEFARAYAKSAQNLVVGDPADDTTDIGPLVNQASLQKVSSHVDDALSKGARIITGGKALHGLFYAPTVITDIKDNMLIMQEESFGPIAPIISFDSEEEVLKMANNTEYGLAAYIYTNNLSRAYKVAEALEYGIIGVNDGVPSAPYAPFGGLKQSGLGREGGKWGIEEFLETKYISVSLTQ